MKRLGVLGGGQLGRMMGLAGLPLGLEFTFLDTAPDACAGSVGTLIRAGFSDAAAISRMADEIDVATFDFENVPESSALIMQEKIPFYPPPNALGSCQDRLLEKDLLTSLGIPVSAYHTVSGRPDLLAGLDHLGYPSVLKTRRFGYDGKGQAVLRDQEDLERAWQALGDHELILESFVPFDLECSLIGVRSASGEIRYWPLTRNEHVNGILMLSRAGGLGMQLQQTAQSIMQGLMEHFNYVGVLTLEFFLQDGALLVNEIAPRVHNSGHWTIDGAETSQFENHLRAITGMPLGSTAQKAEAIMFNWIGDLPDRGKALSIPGVHWHEYGKTPRPGRKIGHATLTAQSTEELMAGATRLAEVAGGNFSALLEALFSSDD